MHLPPTQNEAVVHITNLTSSSISFSVLPNRIPSFHDQPSTDTLTNSCDTRSADRVLPRSTTSKSFTKTKGRPLNIHLTSHTSTSISSSEKIGSVEKSADISVSDVSLSTHTICLEKGKRSLKWGGKSWEVETVGESWRVYKTKIAKREYQMLILEQRNLAGFLGELPDEISLAAVVLPGTHDTMALYGWPVSQCQSLSTPLIVQLVSGIRVLDIRLSLIKDRLIAYHGIYPQRTPFASILSTLFTFLSSPQSSNETLVISIKQEDFMTTPWLKFSTAVLEEIKESEGRLDMWYLEDRIPTLGEVRGKCILFSRFGGDGSGWEGGLNGMGIHPKTWPDSEKEGFEWDCSGVTVRTHDWYNIPSFLSIPEKTQLATEILLSPSSQSASAQTLNIAFFSAASFPLAFPPTIARGFGFPKIGLGVEGVNARVGKWLIDILSLTSFKLRGEKESEKLQDEMNEVGRRVRGWPLLDFFQDPEDNGVIPLLVECNFRGRVSGEEGWP